MRILMAQINSVVGDFPGNFSRIAQVLKSSHEADIIVFPECALCGYPPQDLLDYPQFAETAQAYATRLASEFPRTAFIFGSVEKNIESGKPLRNVAYVAMKGEIKYRYFKRLLPTYDVFDEDRFFEPGRAPLIFDFLGKKVSVTICEDIWANASDDFLKNRYIQNPTLESEGADLMINISASPFESKKVVAKRTMLCDLAKNHQLPIVYVNAVGANDSIIFDGRSYYIDRNGNILYQGEPFGEDLKQIDIYDQSLRPLVVSEKSISDLYDALKLGVFDYCEKSKFSNVVVGMSGGIDSSLVVCLAADALGPENVIGVLMPSRFTSGESNEDALAMARIMQNPIHLLPIEPMFSMALQTLGRAFEGTEFGLAEENLQSRIRGALLMGLSNKFGHLLLTTGNKSELAVGYCTLYGDMNGGLAPLADVYKTQVYALAREANRRQQRIPERVFTKAPTAELRLNQTDQDTLPPYEVLDSILEKILENFETKEQILSSGVSEDTLTKIYRWISQSEFKRYQMPLGLKVSSKAFGIGRRIPIVHRFFKSS